MSFNFEDFIAYLSGYSLPNNEVFIDKNGELWYGPEQRLILKIGSKDPMFRERVDRSYQIYLTYTAICDDLAYQYKISRINIQK